jgi:general secretion pathway protein G
MIIKRGKSLYTQEKGFTLIELIVVIAVLAVLATVAIPRVTGVLQRAKDNTLEANISIVQNAIERYNAETGNYPSNFSDLTSESTIDGKKYGPYLEKVPDEITKNYTITDGKIVKKTA